MISDQANFLQSLGWAALNSLWQMAILWILLQIVNSVFSLKSSAKSFIAANLLFVGFGWFLFTFISTYNNSANITFISNSILNIQADPKINNWFLKALPITSIIYLSVLIFPVLRFAKNYRYVNIIRRHGLSKIDIDTRIYINKTASHLDIKRKVQIWFSELISSPVTIGFLKPIILVPVAAVNNLTTQQLEAVLLHELAHIKRSDYLINLLINLIQTILYFNPFVKAFIKTTETEREKSCDELVLQFQYNSYEYASALLELEKVNQAQQILTLAATGNKNDLLVRIENILNIKKKSIVTLRKVSGMALTLSFIIIMNIVFFFSLYIPSNSTAGNSVIFGVPKYVFEESPEIKTKTTELNSESILSSIAVSAKPVKITAENNVEFNAPAIITENNKIPNPEFINIALNLSQVPELKEYQEVQIKSALEASKKVLENSQWKNVEKNIADVFTQKEKEELKKSYQKEIENFDWSKWENKLRTVYDNINWEKVNYELSNAITLIKIDSIQNVYANVSTRLYEVQKELATKNLPGIPDTDITLEKIIEKKKMAQQILNELKKVKNKKIVHL